VILRGLALAQGAAKGAVAVVAPLSFWGGYDPATGVVIDRSHHAFGTALAGRIVAMPSGRGSSSSSSVLAEAIRRGNAPAALVLVRPDPILAVGAMVAAELYRRSCPVIVLEARDHATLAKAAFAMIETDSRSAVVTIENMGSPRPA
jgi:predicted aconitase with swiveling domain